MRDAQHTACQGAAFTANGRRPAAPTLVAKVGGSYAAMLGIELTDLNPDEIYKWFLAAVLYGARIAESVATRTWREFEQSGILTPQRMIDSGWDGLVAILDRGGYVRYDYKTATKLLEINRTLLAGYGGNLNALHAAAADSADLERRIMALGKGIGEVTAHIFLRELRGKWSKANPPLATPALMAARALGYLPAAIGDDPDKALGYLQRLWQKQDVLAKSFPDFEAALVREGLRLRRRSSKFLA
ncbi:MAG TPA: hypothetical protein VMV97_14485 [Sulfuriferula sp.]|nr:hypothetical protein [Sulfuriferula sp.]